MVPRQNDGKPPKGEQKEKSEKDEGIEGRIEKRKHAVDVGGFASFSELSSSRYPRDESSSLRRRDSADERWISRSSMLQLDRASR